MTARTLLVLFACGDGDKNQVTKPRTVPLSELINVPHFDHTKHAPQQLGQRNISENR